MITDMLSVGLSVEKHHHEVAPSQCELGIQADSILPCADNVQLYKYVVQNTANSFGYTATFMPKPVYGDNVSGSVHSEFGNGSSTIQAVCEWVPLV